MTLVEWQTRRNFSFATVVDHPAGDKGGSPND